MYFVKWILMFHALLFKTIFSLTLGSAKSIFSTFAVTGTVRGRSTRYIRTCRCREAAPCIRLLLSNGSRYSVYVRCYLSMYNSSSICSWFTAWSPNACKNLNLFHSNNNIYIFSLNTSKSAFCWAQREVSSAVGILCILYFHLLHWRIFHNKSQIIVIFLFLMTLKKEKEVCIQFYEEI